jgi:hypothetical protein
LFIGRFHLQAAISSCSDASQLLIAVKLSPPLNEEMIEKRYSTSLFKNSFAVGMPEMDAACRSQE